MDNSPRFLISFDRTSSWDQIDKHVEDPDLQIRDEITTEQVPEKSVRVV